LPADFRRTVAGRLGRTLAKADWPGRPLHVRTALQAFAGSGAESYARRRSVTSRELRDLLYRTDVTRELQGYRAEQPLVSLMKSAPARSGLDQAQYADLAFGLPGDVLTRADRTSMAAGLEAREPMLDHRLVEFAACLPERMRVRGMQGKWLLRKAMRRYLPEAILGGREPGVRMPIAEWLRGPLAGEMQAMVSSAALARTGWFDTGLIARMAEAHRSGRNDHSSLLWQLLVLDRSLVRLGVIS